MKILKKERKCSYLPDGANIFYVGEDNKFMVEAKEVARLSNEQQQPVGEVIVYNNQIIQKAYNRSPLTNLFLIKLHQKFCIRKFLHIPTGKYYWICPGCASKKHHAEYRICKQLLRDGIPGKPIDLYMWGHWACCSSCCDIMEKVKIDNLYLLKNSEILFNPKKEGNIIGKQFKL